MSGAGCENTHANLHRAGPAPIRHALSSQILQQFQNCASVLNNSPESTHFLVSCRWHDIIHRLLAKRKLEDDR